MRRPIVGLSCYLQDARWGCWERPAAVLQTTYTDTVAAAGGLPVVIPPAVRDPASVAAELVGVLDALVLVGGEDVGDNPVRDAHEHALLAAALDRDIPVLAVCRGLQLLNLHLGGSLIHDLPARGVEGHRPSPGQFAPVVVEAGVGTRVERMMGERFEVQCSHHQAVDQPGEGLEVTARASDGVVEAVEVIPGSKIGDGSVIGGSFVVGVQWHPEEDGDTRLFGALVAEAVRRVVPPPVKPQTVNRAMGELFVQRRRKAT